MGRTVERMRAVGARRAALLLAVVVLAAALAVAACAGERSETGAGPRTEAGVEASDERAPVAVQPDESGEGEATNGAGKLTLTLIAPTTCEVERASREAHATVVGKNEETGEEQFKFGDWTDVPTVLVRWQTSGGVPPYTLVIDGEPRDATGEHVGGAGGALVSCALENGETYFSDRWGPMQRWHRTEPVIDSGLKTIRATVTDSVGATGSASIEVYAVRKIGSSGTTLEAGKTYRVHGHLLTVPLGVDMLLTGTAETDCEGEDCESAFQIVADDAFLDDGIRSGHGVGVWIGHRTGRIQSRLHEYDQRLLPADDPRNKGGSAEHPLHAKFDQLVESIGRLPRVDRP